ncbi:MAG: SDR family oxidoreductase [Chloroflexi bacterium]|nr:SDR family oxidoreductase [Chloroflexota bacterium]
MDLELRGKAAIVTGGSRGIGKAIARELAREGASVVVAARGREALEATAAEISDETDMPVTPIAADTARADSVRDMVSRAVDVLGGVDILVNSAAEVGSRVAFPLPEIDVEVFRGELNVKVLGALRCIQHVAPHMIRRGWGRIINISGMNARNAGSVIGSARNVALVAMTKNIADELGPHGINVTVVHPGLTLTERYHAQAEATAAERGVPLETVINERFGANVLGRPMTAIDVAYVVTFLASPKATAINGDVIAVAGGYPRAIYY